MNDEWKPAGWDEAMAQGAVQSAKLTGADMAPADWPGSMPPPEWDDAKVPSQTPPPHPERVNILLDGATLTSGGRDASYGDPSVNLSCANLLKRVFWYFQASSPRKMSPAESEAIDQVLSKLGRVATGPVVTRDTYVDGSTYFAIAGEAAINPQPFQLDLFKDL